MRPYEFTASVGAHDPGLVFDQVASWPAFSSGAPSRVMMGHDEVPPREWRRIRDAQNPLGGIAIWEGIHAYSNVLSTVPSLGRVSFRINEWTSSARDTLDALVALRHDVVCIGALYQEEWATLDVRRWSFSRQHVDHGWGCLFRGAGHDRLVSRRWLDFGPWRVVYLPNDTTFIQFHDLAITDPMEAYEQAKVGHQRMGIDPIGGYIQGIDPTVIAQVRGFYAPDQRRLEIVVAPRIEVSQQEMRVACALRLHHRLTNQAQGRVEQIAYVFIDRVDAEAHLHELWLRELECWYVDERGKHRLDAEYHPTPTPPAWVANLGTHSINDV
jgi:hypothetical protein